MNTTNSQTFVWEFVFYKTNMKLQFTRYATFIYLAFISTGSLWAQFTLNYTPISSSGELPLEFTSTARSISEQEVKTVPSGKDQRAKKEFIIANNYFIRDLLLSGDVLVNDPLSKYVNRVADELLKNQPAFRQQLHIYVTKSAEVNAYAFDKGYIFINVGLLAQLENEAQLAFVLAHEMTHILKKHSINQYIEEIQINDQSAYEMGNEEGRVLAKYRFSKEQEGEADMEGLKLVKQSNYSIKALSGAFDVLQYSYLPFELTEFDKSFFEDNNLVIADTLFLKKVSEIKANDDYDDSKSSHPNIRKRRGAMAQELVVNDESSRRKYLVSEEEFKQTREIARMELCRSYLMSRDYVNAVYAAYIQLKKYPENLFLKKIVAQALYNILVNKTAHKKDTDYNGGPYSFDDDFNPNKYTIPDYNTIEGASQRLYYMLDNMSSPELNAVAISYTYKAHKKYPEDKVLASLTDSLFSELINTNNLFIGDFSSKSKREIKMADTANVTASLDQEESKYSQIKKQQQKTEIETEENFVKYAFVDLLKDEEFVARYSKMANGLTHKPISTEEYIFNKSKKHKKKKKGDQPLLGIDKVAFISPFYMKVKIRKGNDLVDFYASEEKQKDLSEIQEKCAERLGLEYAHISTKDIQSGDIKRYNDNALINEWLEERFSHGDNNDEIVTTSEYTRKLIEELGTKYIAWSGIYNSKGKIYRTTYFFMLMDMETGKLMKFESRYIRAKDNKDMITSFMYNSLMHIKKKAKGQTVQ
jgi:beta-barrel assembly-enhancing protease